MEFAGKVIPASERKQEHASRRTARFHRPGLQPPIFTSPDGSGWFCPAHRLHEHCHPAICARLWAATGDCDSRSSWSKPLARPKPTADGEHFAVAVGRCSRFNPVHLQRSSLAKHAASGCAVVLRCKQSEGEWGRIRFHGAFGYRVRCAVWIGSGVEVFES